MLTDAQVAANHQAEAERYVRAGFSVFPCGRKDDKDKYKAPWCRFSGGHAATTVEAVRELWSAFPHQPIGLFLSPGMLVVDLDFDGAEEAFEEHFGKPLPPTVRSRTGKGWHLWYRYPEDQEINQGGGRLQEIINPSNGSSGIDVRVGGKGYVLAPPSVRYDGPQYFWWGEDIRDGAELTELPAWMLELLQSRPVRDKDCDPTYDPDAYPLDQRVAGFMADLEALGPAIRKQYGGCPINPATGRPCHSNGDEHRAEAVWLSCDWGVPEEIARDLLHEWNYSCQPPWDEGEFDDRFYYNRYNGQRPEGNRLSGLWRERIRDLVRGRKETLQAKLETQPDMPAKERKAAIQEIKRIEDRERLEAYQSAHGFTPELGTGDNATTAMQVCAFYTTEVDGQPVQPASEWGLLWQYREGLWRKIKKEQISSLIMGWSGMLRADGKPFRVDSTHTAFTLALDAPVAWGRGPGWLEGGQGLAFANRFLKVTPEGIAEETPGPENRATNGYPFDFAEHPTPHFDRYLRSIWKGCPDIQERIMLLQEFVGAALFGLAPRYHKALVLHGPAGTGKSTFLQVVKALFPGEMCSSVDPQKFDDDNNTGGLINSRLNTVEEMSAKHITNLERIKMVIDGAPIQVNIKYQNAFEFRPTAAHLLAANTLPPIADIHPSFWDRFVVLRLENNFRDSPDRDRDIAAKMQDELPGIAYWAVQGANRLLQQDDYTIPPSSDEALLEWKESTNAVTRFVSQFCEILDPKENTRSTWIRHSEICQVIKTWVHKDTGSSIGNARIAGYLKQIDGVHAARNDKGVCYNLRKAIDPFTGMAIPKKDTK